MASPTSTRIGDRNIPVQPGEAPVVQFTGGRRGPSEAGSYEFWTVFNQTGLCTGRWPLGGDPGDRFRLMEKSKADKECWKIVANADGIRPATEGEVLGWLRIKPGDRPFARSFQINGATRRFRLDGEDIRLEDADE